MLQNLCRDLLQALKRDVERYVRVPQRKLPLGLHPVPSVIRYSGLSGNSLISISLCGFCTGTLH